MNEVKNSIEDIKLENFIPIDINLTELIYTFKQTNLSKVGGDDGLSSYMLLNINQSFVNSYILFFYKFIFNFCVIVPTNFNIIHIVPIIK